jgi:hypothetical protein
MDAWEKLALNAGLPGVMLIAFLYAIKLAVAAWKDIATERVKIDDRRLNVEERKADAHVAALASLGAKIDSHQTNDLQSHQTLTAEVAKFHGKLDGLIDGLDRTTPIEGVPRISGEYLHRREKTRP